MNRNLMILAHLLAASSIFACGRGGPPSDNEAQVERSEHPMGTAFDSKRVRVLVKAVEARQKVGPNEHYTTEAAPGKTIVGVRYLVENRGQKNISMFATASVRLETPGGQTVDPDVSATTNYGTEVIPSTGERMSFNRQLGPGESRDRAVAFEVDTSAWEKGGFQVVVDGRHVVKVVGAS